MPRTRKSIAVLCVAIVVFSAILSNVATHWFAILVPICLVLPALSVVVTRRTFFHGDEQSASLLSLALSRAPPVHLPLA